VINKAASSRRFRNLSASTVTSRQREYAPGSNVCKWATAERQLSRLGSSFGNAWVWSGAAYPLSGRRVAIVEIARLAPFAQRRFDGAPGMSDPSSLNPPRLPRREQPAFCSELALPKKMYSTFY
jgi:hypothetical protein